MVRYERRHGIRFEILVVHDAEDLAHPHALRLSIGFRESIKWSRCQSCRSPPASVIGRTGCTAMNSPSSSSKTSRSPGPCGLSSVQQRWNGLFFSIRIALSEDYETNLRIVLRRVPPNPVQLEKGGRWQRASFFPRQRRVAIRQRSRWVAGIALEAWERHGWRAPRRQWYWFWRHRKGLLFVFWVCGLLAGYRLRPK
jgi:adsorption protein B